MYYIYTQIFPIVNSAQKTPGIQRHVAVDSRVTDLLEYIEFTIYGSKSAYCAYPEASSDHTAGSWI